VFVNGARRVEGMLGGTARWSLANSFLIPVEVRIRAIEGGVETFRHSFKVPSQTVTIRTGGMSEGLAADPGRPGASHPFPRPWRDVFNPTVNDLALRPYPTTWKKVPRQCRARLQSIQGP